MEDDYKFILVNFPGLPAQIFLYHTVKINTS